MTSIIRDIQGRAYTIQIFHIPYTLRFWMSLGW